MTTITNFLQGNFIEQQGLHQKETPIWVIFAKNKTISASVLPLMYKYMLQQHVHNNRPLIQVDLGLSTIRKVKQAECIPQYDGKLYKINNTKCHYLVRWTANQRKKQDSLKNTINFINSLPTSQFMKAEIKKNNLAEKLKNSTGLIIQGIQLVATLPDFKDKLEQFIGSLSNLHKNYKQITIIINSPQILSKQHRFVLQRISTCLTEVQQNTGEQQWVCTSTVRRYTGFSNQQKYFIRSSALKNEKIRIKVEKFQKKKQQKETQAQKQMISSLGFDIKKDGSTQNTQRQDLKKMIYPHLRVRQNIQSGKTQSKCCNCDVSHCPGCEGDQDLIILDQQQEDEDDIDV